MLSAVDSADASGHLTDWGRASLQWLRDFAATESNKLGQLAELGRQELFANGARFGNWINQTMVDVVSSSGQGVVFESTFKQRTVDSRDAFMREYYATHDPAFLVGK